MYEKVLKIKFYFGSQTNEVFKFNVFYIMSKTKRDICFFYKFIMYTSILLFDQLIEILDNNKGEIG